MHNHHNFSFVASALLLTSCMGSDGDGDVIGTDSANVDVCDCEFPAVTAADVSFDNAGTSLQSVSVQDAIGEVAARETPDFADRITVQENEVTASVGTEISVLAVCGGNPGEFLAIGGGCSSDTLSNMTMLQSGLTDELMRCNWRKPDGVSKTVKARVTCLSLLP